MSAISDNLKRNQGQATGIGHWSDLWPIHSLQFFTFIHDITFISQMNIQASYRDTFWLLFACMVEALAIPPAV